MALTPAQYETLFNDNTIAPRIKMFGSRLIRDWRKANLNRPDRDVLFLQVLNQLSQPGFVEAVRVQALGELDDADRATPSVGEQVQAMRVALRSMTGLADL